MASIVSALKFPSLPFGRSAAKLRSASAQNDSELTASPGMEVDAIEVLINEPFTLSSLMGKIAGTNRRVTAWQIPLIGRLPFSKQIEALSVLVTLLLLLTLATFGISVWDSRLKREQALVSNEMQVLSQRIANLAQQAASGNHDGFKPLDEARARLVADLALLSQGGSATGSIFRLHRRGRIPSCAESSSPGARSMSRSRRSSGNSRTSCSCARTKTLSERAAPRCSG